MNINNHEIFEIISNKIKINISELNLHSKITDIQEWDSLANLQIIMELEKKYKIKINFTELITVDQISDLVEIIKNKLKI